MERPDDPTPPALSHLSHKVAVRSSPIHGRGLFALEPLTRGELVAVKGGHVFDRATLRQVERTLGPAEIQIDDDLFIGPLLPEEREGSMIFSNHSCDPNLGVRGQIAFVALRDVAAGEELTHDWAMTDDDDYQMQCRCGSPRCRGVVTGQDWRRQELQRRYAGHMSAYLQARIQTLGEAHSDE